jgi:signal transduction histidine kinase
MRTLLAQLRTPLDPEATKPLVNFSQRCRKELNELEAHTGLRITRSLPSSILMPAPQVNETISILHEAIHNIAHHSGVSEASCRVEQKGNRLKLIITDQGRGFVLNEAFKLQGHYGLQGMQERAAALNGELHVKTSPGRGTTLILQFPLSEQTYDPHDDR